MVQLTSSGHDEAMINGIPVIGSDRGGIPLWWLPAAGWINLELMPRARAKGITMVFNLHNFGYNDRRGFADVSALIFPSEYLCRFYRGRLGRDRDPRSNSACSGTIRSSKPDSTPWRERKRGDGTWSGWRNSTRSSLNQCVCRKTGTLMNLPEFPLLRLYDQHAVTVFSVIE
jgi:hypothetical protein